MTQQYNLQHFQSTTMHHFHRVNPCVYRSLDYEILAQGTYGIAYHKCNNVLHVHLGSISDIDYTL